MDLSPSRNAQIGGIWVTDNPGGHYDETLVFYPDGRGVIDYYNVLFCGSQTFSWRVVEDDFLVFDRIINLFRSDRVRFTTHKFTNGLGEDRDMIMVYHRPDGEPFKLVRSSNTADDYNGPEL